MSQFPQYPIKVYCDKIIHDLYIRSSYFLESPSADIASDLIECKVRHTTYHYYNYYY